MDKTDKYYIIGQHYKDGCGLICIAFQTLYYIVYAVNNGYIPIIDMKHFSNPYFKDNREFKDDVWKYYFEELCNYRNINLDDTSEVRYSAPEDIMDLSVPCNSDFPGGEITDYKLNEKLQEYKEYFNKYIRFNTETKQ